ncbi:MAG: hypothetical protein LBR07_08740 [Puniceicoccales bacterium]|jgi:hypothetical protein|nr:hypothetical protein [Puniceicoccales bacterium]
MKPPAPSAVAAALGITLAAALPVLPALPAAPLNTRGLPPQTLGLAHLDLEAARKSAFGAAALERLLRPNDDDGTAGVLKRTIGVAFDKEVADITVAFLPAAEKSPAAETAPPAAAKSPATPPPAAFVFARGTFDASMSVAFAGAGATQKPRVLRARRFVSPDALIKKINFGANDALLGSPAAGTLLFGDAVALDTVLAAFDAAGKPAPLPLLPPVPLKSGAPAPLLLVRLGDGVVAGNAAAAGASVTAGRPKSIAAALTDDEKVLRLRLCVEFPTPPDAVRFRAEIQRLLGYALLRKAELTAAGAKREAALVGQFHESARHEIRDRTVTFDAELPAAKGALLARLLLAGAAGAE